MNRLTSFRLWLAAFSCVMFAVLPARAWNSLGHRTVAEIAWRQMTPAQRQAASELLREHPHYKLLLATNIPAGVDTNEWVFLTAAIWPDIARPAKAGEPPRPRSITKYAIYPHGINRPFLRAGDTNVALLKKFTVPTPNAETGLAESIATLQDPKAKARDRALSLCWVLHLCGDLHQPLHAAVLLTPDKPKGHGLGGGVLVRNLQGEPLSLHTFWDQLPGPDGTYRGITALTDQLTAAPELKPERMQEYQNDKTVESWGRESFEAAVSFGYAESQVRTADAAAVKAGKIQTNAIPMVTAGYARQAEDIAQHRLALAGQRLTDILKRVWAEDGRSSQ